MNTDNPVEDNCSGHICFLNRYQIILLKMTAVDTFVFKQVCN